MNKISFREAQLGAFGVLKYIDQLCEKLGLRYYLMYGTLIGAIRENGIIPWDDDIDVMMPRPDYDKLIMYCKENDDEMSPFKLFEKRLVKDYPHPIARMSDMRYKIEFDNEKDYGIGLFVDIYPLDGVGNDLKKASKLEHKAYRNSSLCFLTSRKKFGVDNTKTKLKMVLKVPAYIWANLMGNNHYIQKANKLCHKYSFEDSMFVACVAQPWCEKHGENKNVYSKDLFDSIKVDFEGEKFCAPIGYDTILRMGYGDYMTPLPEGERGTHHTYDTFLL